MPKRASISSFLIAGWMAASAAVADATPPVESVDWATRLPGRAWVLGAQPWQDRASCNQQVCNAGLNASPLLLNVRFTNSQLGRQLSLHGSVVGCPTTFQRFLALDGLDGAHRQRRFDDLLGSMLTEMRTRCPVAENRPLPPLLLAQLIPDGGH